MYVSKIIIKLVISLKDIAASHLILKRNTYRLDFPGIQNKLDNILNYSVCIIIDA